MKEGERRSERWTNEQDGGIINLGNTFFKQEQKRRELKNDVKASGGEENGLQKEGACMGE